MEIYVGRKFRCRCGMCSLGSKVSVVKFHVVYGCMVLVVVGWLSKVLLEFES